MGTVRLPDIVFSTAGHDKNGAFLLVGEDSSTAYLVNGSTRKLANPKRKNLKHIASRRIPAPEGIARAIDDGSLTDKLIRKELASFATTSE